MSQERDALLERKALIERKLEIEEMLQEPSTASSDNHEEDPTPPRRVRRHPQKRSKTPKHAAKLKGKHFLVPISKADLPFNLGPDQYARKCNCNSVTVSPDEEHLKRWFKEHQNSGD